MRAPRYHGDQPLMSWWSRLALAIRSTMGGWFGPYGSNDPALMALFGAKPTSSGVTVDETKALNSSVVWACVNLIAGTIGSLPLLHYRRLANGDRERFTDSRLYRVLHDTPNDETAAPVFWETQAQHLLLWGNSFAEIRRNARNEVSALYLIEPWRVQWFRSGAGELRYRIDGETVLTPDEVLHVPGLTPDGIWGYSPIQKAREALGLLLAAERFGGTFFGQGSSFGGILTHPGRLNEVAEKNLRTSLEQRAQGVDRAHNFIILQEGMTYEQLGVPPNDAQFLETRQFQVTEIARWFGVPPHMIGDVERSTSWGTGIEQQAIGFVKFCLRRWLVRFEKEIARKLISPLELNYQFVEFLVDGLERGDFASRVNGYVALKNAGLTTANRVATLENWETFGPEGDILFNPSNQLPAELLAEGPPKPAPPPPPPPAPSSNGNGNQPAARDAFAEELKQLIALGQETHAAVLELPFDALTERVAALPTEIPPPPALPPPAPPIDLAPILEKFDTVEQALRAQQDRVTAMLPGVQGLIEDAAREFVRREVDRAKRAASSADKLTEWMGAFYPRHAEYALTRLRHPMRLYRQLLGRTDDPDGEIRTRIAEYTAASCARLAALLTAPPETLRHVVSDVVDRWEADRPAALVHALMADEVTHGT
jgi:HK97 family phage portal protein